MEVTQLIIPTSPGSRGFSTSSTLHRMSDPKERFYRHFQTEITCEASSLRIDLTYVKNHANIIMVTAIQDQIDDLVVLSPVNGERQDCIDTILAGISRLSNEVADARDFVPAYDQRAYSLALKGLTEKLNEATGKFSRKSRFQFKSKTGGQKPTDDTTQQAKPRQDSRHLIHAGITGRDGTATDSSTSAINDDEESDAVGGLPTFSGKNYNEEMSRPVPGNNIRKPSFSSAKTISIYSQTGLHIMLPSSASRATSSGSLTDLNRCIVDMTIPTAASSGTPFAGLALKTIKQSLLICGTVAGPVHVTGIKDSVIVVAARQVRIHECKNVSFYLRCGSHPIIEDCSDVRFAPLPQAYAEIGESTGQDQWDQVDDFKWLKNEPSPNWSIIPEDKRLPADVWTKDVLSNPSLSTDDVLRKVGVSGL